MCNTGNMTTVNGYGVCLKILLLYHDIITNIYTTVYSTTSLPDEHQNPQSWPLPHLLHVWKETERTFNFI